MGCWDFILVGNRELKLDSWVLGFGDVEDAFKVVNNKLAKLFVVFIFCAMDFFPFVYPPNQK